ncbi:ATP-dependent DNA helicase MER3 [Hypoxylon texense]
MTSGVGSDGDSHIYGFPNRIGRDRHTQNIIDHTNTLFPDFSRRLPRFNTEYGVLSSQLDSQGGDDDQDLDDFGSPLVTHKKASNLKLNLERAPGEPPVVKSIRLVDPRQALPDKFRNVFPYELFNAVQSKCFPLVYGTTDNVVVSAPTGCGKTAILEMAICKLVMSPGSENFKIVYQAPTKSLCSERARDWEKKFSHMNLQCIELTGDTSQAQASRVGNASIIVTTPEKWDSITRKWSDHRKLLETIRLVLIDEVHILKDTRGATLEAVVSRMKTIGANVRFIALSATVPNIGDVARWLGCDHVNPLGPARTEAFGEEFRPVKLQRYVYGYPGGDNDFIFNKTLDGKLSTVLAKHSKGKPIMIFCFTRKSCEQTAQRLAEWWSSSRAEDRAWPAPTRRVPVINRELQEIARYGVAFHHAGLDAQDRSAVAQNFLEGQIHVICCTSTLAVGVNLPCHTVILKGTTGYSDNRAQEYSDLEVMQMLGRAGRPQFDDSAVAIIMTRAGNVDRYKKMMSGDETLESTLHRNLVEHLNSEISLGTIQDVQTAKKWIGGTFLSVRVRQSPSLYLEGARNADDADETMGEWCEKGIESLQQCGLVTESTPFKCTEYGHAMSRYMVKFETMTLLLSIPRGARLEEILKKLSTASELRDFRFKPDERALFRELNKSPFILHPIKETVTEVWHKVFLIIQVYLGCVELPSEKGFGHLKGKIAADKIAIFDRLNRLVRCFVDCRAFDGDGLSTKAGLELARALAANSWDNKPSQLSQIPGSGPVTVRKWVSQGIHTVLSLADRDFEELERISSRNPPYGMNLLKTLEKFPRLAMRAQLVASTARRFQPEDNVTVALKVNLGYRNAKGIPTWNGKVPAVTFMVLTTDGNLACFWRGNLKRIDRTTGLDLEFPVVLSEPGQKISCYFSCEEIVGTQVTKILQPDVPEAAFKRQTQSAPRQMQVTSLLDDDTDYEEVPDEDMLIAVLSSAKQSDEIQQAEHLDPIEDDFTITSAQDEDSLTLNPKKMDNGKWMCNHPCRNGGLTATGKACQHRCCHEGVDKPRTRRPHQDNKRDNKSTRDNETAKDSSAVEYPAQYRRTSQAVMDNSKRNRQADSESAITYASENTSSKKTPAKRDPKATLANVKRKRMNENDDNGKMPVKRRSQTQGNASDLDATSDIECIDLTMIANNSMESRPQLTRPDPTKKAKAKTPRKAASSSPVLQTSKSDFPHSSMVGYDEAPEDLAKMDMTGRDHTHSQYAYDSLEDDDLLDLDIVMQDSKSKKGDTHQAILKEDETLFTTVDALQKAPERFDLPSVNPLNTLRQPTLVEEEPDTQGFNSPLLEPGRVTQSSSASERGDKSPLFFDSDPFQLATNTEVSSEPVQSDPDPDPAWLSEFDSEFIDSLRGCVNFVD